MKEINNIKKEKGDITANVAEFVFFFSKLENIKKSFAIKF